MYMLYTLHALTQTFEMGMGSVQNFSYSEKGLGANAKKMPTLGPKLGV